MSSMREVGEGESKGKGKGKGASLSSRHPITEAMSIRLQIRMQTLT